MAKASRHETWPVRGKLQGKDGKKSKDVSGNASEFGPRGEGPRYVQQTARTAVLHCFINRCPEGRWARDRWPAQTFRSSHRN